MNFLLRRIAGTLRQMSLIQLGLRRHNVARFRFLGIAFIRLISFTLVSTLGLAVFGVGFYHTLIGFDIVQPSSQVYSVLIYIMSLSAAWISIVCLNHIHDISMLMSNLDSVFDLLYIVPAFLLVAVVSPIFDMFSFIWTHILIGDFKGLFIDLNHLEFYKEIFNCFFFTIPQFGTMFYQNYLLIWFNNSLNYVIGFIPVINFHDIGLFFINHISSCYDWLVGRTTEGVQLLLPNWLQGTRIGTAIAASIASFSISAFIINWVVRWLFGW